MSQPGDRSEQEADRAAERVTSMGRHDTTLRPRTTVGRDPPAPAPSSSGSGGDRLDEHTRRYFDARFDHNFANVRVHADDAADRTARALGARAFTIGDHVSFARGEYQPGTDRGRYLLAHELAHVVQHSGPSPHQCDREHALGLSRVPADRVQRTLIATGDAAGFVAACNLIIAVQFRVVVSNTGVVTIEATDVQGPPTRDAQELLNTLRTLINDPNATTIEFVHGATSARASDRSVIVGNYQLARVDLDDVAAFGNTSSHSRMGDNAAVQLVHELTEQYRRQVHGESFDVAHQAGYRAQERVLGATIESESPMTPTTGTLGEVTTIYRYPDGRRVEVITTIDFATGNVTNVRRRVLP